MKHGSKAMMSLAAVLVVCLATMGATWVLPGAGNHQAGAAASAFAFVQKKGNSNDGGAVTGATMDSSITAGHLVVAIVKWETTSANLTGFTENGVAGTILTPKTQTDLESVICYKLSATGGGTSIGLTWSGSPTWSRVIVMTFSYGGTASFVTSVTGGADTHSGTVETADATNSGTYRLNIAAMGNYAAITPGSPRIGTTAGSEFTNQSDTHMWYTTNNLAGGTDDDADATWAAAGSTAWTMWLASFAAN